MSVCPRNTCAGAHGNCLDVKITNYCNADCDWCIEKDGYEPAQQTPGYLAVQTVAQHDYPTVLILGGEPTSYPGLIEYLQLIRPHKKKIYLTTNGTRLFDLERTAQMSELLDGLNISIHHYRMVINDKILQGSQGLNKTKNLHLDFNEVRQAIKICHQHNCPVRINCNLVAGRIDNPHDAREMILMAWRLGADSIRFTELQDAPEDYVDARTVFTGLTDDPFHDGCEGVWKDNSVPGIEVIVKQSCGHVAPTKPPETEYPVRTGGYTKVIYSNGEVQNGWTKPHTKPKKSTRSKAKPDPGCHGPECPCAGCHDFGCHGPVSPSGGCHC